MPVLRPVTLADAAELGRLVAANRDFLAPWEPARAASYFTEAGQHADLEAALSRRELDLQYPFVIVDADGAIVGRINVTNIVRGAGQFGTLGYWVSGAQNGRGFATRAVGEAVAFAFGELNLHRLEAGTLAHNVASQRALLKNGFTQYGMAPKLVRIAGEWQDHALFQLLNDAWVG